MLLMVNFRFDVGLALIATPVWRQITVRLYVNSYLSESKLNNVL